MRAPNWQIVRTCYYDCKHLQREEGSRSHTILLVILAIQEVLMGESSQGRYFLGTDGSIPFVNSSSHNSTEVNVVHALFHGRAKIQRKEVLWIAFDLEIWGSR